MCTWESFVGREGFLKRGLGEADFELIRRWSRLAPRRHRRPDDRPRVIETATLLGWSSHECEQLGLRCRQLMDTARAEYLQMRAGVSSQLVHHVAASVTADNCMIRSVQLECASSGDLR